MRGLNSQANYQIYLFYVYHYDLVIAMLPGGQGTSSQLITLVKLSRSF